MWGSSWRRLRLPRFAACVALATGDYRVTAKTALEGAIQQAATVPFSQYSGDRPGAGRRCRAGGTSSGHVAGS